jgi:hypothetical protein
MSASDHYAQAEQYLADARNHQTLDNPLMAAVAHALLAIAGFVVQFSVPATSVLSDEARDAQRVVEE